MARRKNNRKKIIGGVLLIVIIAVGIVVGLILTNNKNDEYVGDTDEKQGYVVDVKEVEKKEEETDEEYSERLAEEKKVKQYEGEDPNKAEELSGAITYAGVNNGRLMIGMNIDQYLGDGKCELSLIRDGKVIYSADSKIMAEVSTSTCDGYSVPVNSLGSGNTEIVIKLYSGEKNGTIRGEVKL